MKIDRKKLPVKYALEIYTEVPGFPTREDLEYLLITSLEERDLLESEFTAEHVWESYKYCLGTIKELRDFLDSLFQPDVPVADGQVEGFKASSNSYLVKKHAWMN